MIRSSLPRATLVNASAKYMQVRRASKHHITLTQHNTQGSTMNPTEAEMLLNENGLNE